MEKLNTFILMIIKQVIATTVVFFVLTFMSVLMLRMLVPVFGTGMWEIFVPLTLFAIAVPLMIAAQKPSPQRMQ